ncbi:MAG: hypothetical protein MUC50_13640 [Myxococcota bacterium]|nr:hypothetical protein [Myxococcota bacterium]
MAGKTEDGEGIRGLRWRKEQPEGVALTELRPMHEGQPLLHGELVSLSPRQESPLLWDVDVECRVEKGKVVGVEQGRAGPARVVSDNYRQGWEQVFGRPSRPKLPKNELN